MAGNQADDRSLAADLMRTGSEAAFRALYRRHTPGVYRCILRLLAGNVMDAEDAVQETWVRAVRRLPTFRWDSALRTWLVSIALNVSREVMRRSARLDGAAEGNLPAATVPEDLRIDLDRAIGRLPEPERTVLILHDVEGWTHREIGLELGRAEGTSKALLSDARRRMRAMISALGDSTDDT